MTDRWKLIASDYDKFGDFFKDIEKSHSGDLKVALRILLWWLRGDSPIYWGKRQNSYWRRMWHKASTILNLTHITYEFEQSRYYCYSHKKHAKYWKRSTNFYERTYDSDHECSDDDWEDPCLINLNRNTRRFVFIISPELKITNSEELESYLRNNNYYDNPPFSFAPIEHEDMIGKKSIWDDYYLDGLNEI